MGYTVGFSWSCVEKVVLKIDVGMNRWRSGLHQPNCLPFPILAGSEEWSQEQAWNDGFICFLSGS